ncbi:hypothetical protein PFISCL1PPCAC_16585, partial [Pristionchus fissidentatus]
DEIVSRLDGNLSSLFIIPLAIIEAIDDQGVFIVSEFERQRNSLLCAIRSQFHDEFSAHGNSSGANGHSRLNAWNVEFLHCINAIWLDFFFQCKCHHFIKHSKYEHC